MSLGSRLGCHSTLVLIVNTTIIIIVMKWMIYCSFLLSRLDIFLLLCLMLGIYDNAVVGKILQCESEPGFEASDTHVVIKMGRMHFTRL